MGQVFKFLNFLTFKSRTNGMNPLGAGVTAFPLYLWFFLACLFENWSNSFLTAKDWKNNNSDFPGQYCRCCFFSYYFSYSYVCKSSKTNSAHKKLKLKVKFSMLLLFDIYLRAIVFQVIVTAWKKFILLWRFNVFYGLQIISVPHPDVFWYHLNCMGAQKNAPKKVLVTFLHTYFT